MNGGAAEEEDELPEGGDENGEDLDENIEEDMVDIEEDEDEEPVTSGMKDPGDLLEYKDQSDDESSSEEEDDSDDEEYENRVDEEYKQRFIKNIHPEEFHDNYNFIKMMTSVERDDLNLIYDDKHVTLQS